MTVSMALNSATILGWVDSGYKRESELGAIRVGNLVRIRKWACSGGFSNLSGSQQKQPAIVIGRVADQKEGDVSRNKDSSSLPSGFYLVSCLHSFVC